MKRVIDYVFLGGGVVVGGLFESGYVVVDPTSPACGRGARLLLCSAIATLCLRVVVLLVRRRGPAFRAAPQPVPNAVCTIVFNT